MISFNHPSHNRLLDLDQALLSWKQAAYSSRNELSRIENEQTSVLSDRLELEGEGEYEDNCEYEDENETIKDQFEQAADYQVTDNTDNTTELFSSSIAKSGWLSYRRLADRLESRTRGLEYNTLRQHLRDAAVETDHLLPEPSFFSSSRSGAATADHFDGEHLLPLAFSSTEPSTEQPSILETGDFNLPDIDLPDIDLPDADLPTSMPSPQTDSAGKSSSYSSLLQMIQAARWSDSHTDFEDELSMPRTTHTIDVAAQAIADLQNDWDEPLPDLAD